MYKPTYPGSYYFDTFTFTTMGNSGHRGPLPTQMYANAPWDPDQFSIVDGQQQWTVPANGTYQITAAGAYGATPGRVVTGQVALGQDQVLSIIVGQQPTPLTSNAVDNLTVGGSPVLYTSTDGVIWTRKVLAQPFTLLNASTNPCKPCWSPELGLFTIGEAISRDGINWVFGSGASAPPLLCAAWSPQLKLFVGGTAFRSASYYSYDGVTWTAADTSMVGDISSITWSPTLKLFVGVGGLSYPNAPFFIYNSSDGKNWTRVYLENMGYAFGGCVVWSPELSLFVVQYSFRVGTDCVNILISTNGSTWRVPSSSVVHSNSIISDLIWSPALKIFTSATLRDQPGMYNSAIATITL